MFSEADLKKWTEKATAMIAHNITVSKTYHNLEEQYQAQLTEEFKKYEQIQQLEGLVREALIQQTLWYQMINKLKEQYDPQGDKITFNPIASANCYALGLSLMVIPDKLENDLNHISEDQENPNDTPKQKMLKNIYRLMNPQKFSITHLSEIDFFWKHGIKKLKLNDKNNSAYDFITKMLSWYLAAIDQNDDVVALSSVECRLKAFADALNDSLRAHNILRERPLTKQELQALEKEEKPDPYHGATDDGKQAFIACKQGFEVNFCARSFGLHPSNVFIAKPNFSEMATKIIEQTLLEHYSKIPDKKFQKVVEKYHDSMGDFKPTKYLSKINTFEKNVMEDAKLKIEQDYKLNFNALMLSTSGTLKDEVTQLKNVCDFIGLDGMAYIGITYGYNGIKNKNIDQCQSQSTRETKKMNCILL